ncbi:MAG: hypothetical protein ACK52I_30960 [Pseudomonadota bacterium]|jgi:hypothetical protein
MLYDKQSYIVCGQGGFKLSEALKLWKAKYPEFIDFKKDVITNPSLEDFGKFIEEYWNSIIPVTVEEALRQENTEIRRTYFDCIGVQKLFNSLDPKLLNKQIITKKRANWDDENKEIFRTFEDVYELYEIEGKKLFDKDRWGREPNPVYAVRCWCTTTNREYWLYVNHEAATGQRWWGSTEKAKYDAIRAIAWTIRIDVTNPEKIYRQGDIIVVKKSKNSIETREYHLDKKQYLKLMYSET